MDFDDIMACDNCGCLFDKHIAILEKNKREWYGTDCKSKCPGCKKVIEYNLGDGYYK